MLGTIPAIKNCRSVVHFIRIDMGDKGRLNTVVKVLSQQTLPKPIDIEKILRDFD